MKNHGPGGCCCRVPKFYILRREWVHLVNDDSVIQWSSAITDIVNNPVIAARGVSLNHDFHHIEGTHAEPGTLSHIIGKFVTHEEDGTKHTGDVKTWLAGNLDGDTDDYIYWRTGVADDRLLFIWRENKTPASNTKWYYNTWKRGVFGSKTALTPTGINVSFGFPIGLADGKYVMPYTNESGDWYFWLNGTDYNLSKNSGLTPGAFLYHNQSWLLHDTAAQTIRKFTDSTEDTSGGWPVSNSGNAFAFTMGRTKWRRSGDVFVNDTLWDNQAGTTVADNFEDNDRAYLGEALADLINDEFDCKTEIMDTHTQSSFSVPEDPAAPLVTLDTSSAPWIQGYWSYPVDYPL